MALLVVSLCDCTCYYDLCIEKQSVKLTDKFAGATNGSVMRNDTEQHSGKLNQFFEDQ